jgi:hypothetical protein
MRKVRSLHEVWEQDEFGRFLISFILSMLIMLGLFYPTGIAHELGHGVICLSEGGTIFWDWVFTRLALLCDPFPERVKEISWAMGGSFGVIASVVPIFVLRFLRKRNFILNGFLGCAFLQLGYALFESTQNAQYRVNDLSVISSIVLMGAIAIIFFTWRIEKIREYCTRKKSRE